MDEYDGEIPIDENSVADLMELIDNHKLEVKHGVIGLILQTSTSSKSRILY